MKSLSHFVPKNSCEYLEREGDRERGREEESLREGEESKRQGEESERGGRE
jgi:hypothetical protein